MDILKNCFIKSRDGEDLFHIHKDRIHPVLDGYAIIPIEEYQQLEAELAMSRQWAAMWKGAAKFHFSYYDNIKRKQLAECQQQRDKYQQALEDAQRELHGWIKLFWFARNAITKDVPRTN